MYAKTPFKHLINNETIYCLYVFVSVVFVCLAFYMVIFNALYVNSMELHMPTFVYFFISIIMCACLCVRMY